MTPYAFALCIVVAFLQAAPPSGWEVIRDGDVAIHHWPVQARLARTLLPPAATRPFPGLPDDILQRGRDIDVFLAPDAARFDSLTGGRAPEWGAGVAFPRQGVIIVPGYASERAGTQELPRIMRHELAHVALQRHLGDARVPIWFTEGYATWSAGQLDANAGWQLRLALATARAPSLDSLTLDWPLLATDARIAYLLSASAMEYLYSLGAPAMFTRFLDLWAASGDFEESLRTVYVMTSPQFERLWRAYVKRQYGWIQIIAQSAFIWVIATLLVLALFVVRRRRDRRRMESLRANELPDTPAYWLEQADGQSESLEDHGQERGEHGEGHDRSADASDASPGNDDGRTT